MQHNSLSFPIIYLAVDLHVYMCISHWKKGVRRVRRPVDEDQGSGRTPYMSGIKKTGRRGDAER